MAQAQTPQEKADAALIAFWPDVIASQNTYLAAHGKYFQGILTPTMIPPNGALRTVDKTKKPHDQNEDWEAVFGVKIPNTLPCSIEIHVYNGPLGHSFQFYGRVNDAAGNWIRGQGEGPDSVTFPWRLEVFSEI